MEVEEAKSEDAWAETNSMYPTSRKMTKLLPTDSVLEVMTKYIRAADEPILHVPAYQCGQ